jgi:hypothetical protein
MGLSDPAPLTTVAVLGVYTARAAGEAVTQLCLLGKACRPLAAQVANNKPAVVNGGICLVNSIAQGDRGHA